MKGIGKFISTIMVIALMFLMLPGNVRAEETKENKKIISIVYDDSGSMFNDESSWASANYAMQAFAALLNEQDEMYITYMSDVVNGDYNAKEINLSDVENSVKKIREEVCSGSGTPLDAVDVAMDKLVSIKESDENTQFWLVVLTDGAMTSFSKTKYSTVEETLDSYAGTTMSNGTSLYVSYMGIGQEAAEMKSNTSKGLTAYQAKTDIVPVLSEIANKISGRLKFEDDQITQVNGKTIKVCSDIPVYSISVFSQGTNATVTEAKAESSLNIDRNIPLKYPELAGEKTNEKLFGNAAVINNGTGIIQDGDYTITFSEEVSLENVVIMYQPAIKMKAVVTKNGVEVEDYSLLAVGDEIDIEIIPTNPETGEEIKDSDLPDGIKWKVSYVVDDSVKEEKAGKLLSDVTVESGNNKIVASMQVPEYVPMTQIITFTPVVEMEYGIIANNPEKSNYMRNKLGIKNVDGEVTTFQITGDGQPLTKAELNDIKLKVKEVSVDDSWLEKFYEKLGIKNATVKLELNDDGTFSLYPSNIGFPAFLINGGTYNVIVALDKDTSITATGSFKVIPSLADFIDLFKILLAIIFIAYLIYIFFIKYKFNGQTLVIEAYKPEGGFGGSRLMRNMGDTVVLKKYGGDLFMLKRSCQKKVNGIRVYAGPYGEACISGDALGGFDKYGFSSQDPVTSYDSIVMSLKEVKKGKDKDKMNKYEKKAKGNEIILGRRAFFLKQGNKLYKITAQ